MRPGSVPRRAPWRWIDANRTKRINFRSARKSRFNQWRGRGEKATPEGEKQHGRAAKTAGQPPRGFTAFRKQGKVVRERLTCSCCKSKRFQYWNIDPALAAILRHIETEWEADRESARGRSSREGGAGGTERDACKTRSGFIDRGLRLSNSGAEWSWSNSQPDSVLNRATELTDRPAISVTHKTRTGVF